MSTEPAARRLRASMDTDLALLAAAIVEFDPCAARRDEPLQCLNCDRNYSLRSECEPTPLCDRCSHAVVLAFAEELAESNE